MKQEHTDKIRVRIVASQQVRYDQTVTFSREEWEAFKRMGESDAADAVEGWLDLSDVSDAEPIDDDFTAIVVGMDGKPVEPPDAYGE